MASVDIPCNPAANAEPSAGPSAGLGAPAAGALAAALPTAAAPDWSPAAVEGSLGVVQAPVAMHAA